MELLLMLLPLLLLLLLLDVFGVLFFNFILFMAHDGYLQADKTLSMHVNSSSNWSWLEQMFLLYEAMSESHCIYWKWHGGCSTANIGWYEWVFCILRLTTINIPTMWLFHLPQIAITSNHHIFGNNISQQQVVITSATIKQL